MTLHPEFLVYKKRLFYHENSTQDSTEGEVDQRHITVVRFSVKQPRYLLLKEISTISGRSGLVLKQKDCFAYSYRPPYGASDMQGRPYHLFEIQLSA